MNKIKSMMLNYTVIISFLFYSSPSFSMMNCVGSDFYCEDYKNGTILCRPTSFTCKPPDNEWSWAASGMTYAFASAVFSVTLDRILQWQYTKKIWNKTVGSCFKSCKYEIIDPIDGENIPLVEQQK